MKRILTVIVTLALCAAVMCGAAFAEITANALNDGSYNIGVESSAAMFKVVNCDITVSNGTITAAVTLSGTGYGKLFVGTGEQALTASETEYIPFVANADGQYVYTFPISALDTEIAVAAWSTKNEQWYDRTLVFKSDSLPESAYKSAPAAPAAPENTENKGNTGNADKSNPETGVDIAAAFAAVALAAAGIAISRKSRV